MAYGQQAGFQAPDGQTGSQISGAEPTSREPVSREPVSWERFEWHAGAERYSFEVRDRGLIGRIEVSDGRQFALPMVVWEAMLDAVKSHRKSRARTDANLPPRAGARWNVQECDELAAKFRSGRSVSDLAREHSRTMWAIEGQLAKLGLWDKIERRPVLPSG